MLIIYWIRSKTNTVLLVKSVWTKAYSITANNFINDTLLPVQFFCNAFYSKSFLNNYCKVADEGHCISAKCVG